MLICDRCKQVDGGPKSQPDVKGYLVGIGEMPLVEAATLATADLCAKCREHVEGEIQELFEFDEKK